MPAPAESTLAALQARFGEALLAADPDAQQLPEELFAGVHPGAVGLRVHRNTVLGTISNALRMSYVAVNRLVGEVATEHRAAAIEGDGDAGRLRGVAQAGFELRAKCF